MMGNGKMLLVGDNPFHGVSHLSQLRSRARDAAVLTPEYAAGIVAAALESGARGFLFSVNDTTLDILRALRRERRALPALYAIVPYSYAYVRAAIALGGIPGLAGKVGREIVQSRNWQAAALASWGAVSGNPGALVEAYVRYELSRLRAAAAGGAAASVLLHEIVTDMALALDMKWLFDAFLRGARGARATAGFNTRNLALLVRRLAAWRIPVRGLVFAAPFNSIGFQMSPSREACERVLEDLPDATVIAFSVLAAGYLAPQNAGTYLTGLPNISGVAIGASTPAQARQTFELLGASWLRTVPTAPRVSVSQADRT